MNRHASFKLSPSCPISDQLARNVILLRLLKLSWGLTTLSLLVKHSLGMLPYYHCIKALKGCNRVRQTSRETKVAYFGVAVRGYQDIGAFQISMHHVSLV